MFERYTEKARRVIFFARYEASQFGQPYIETEHLLLGLLREDKALTNRFLRSHASVESIRKQIQAHTMVLEKTSTSVYLPISNEGKRVLAYAAEEAMRLGDKHIGTEHLLLGILREEKCFAAEMLKERGIRLAAVRDELASIPQEAKSPSAPEPAPPGEFFRDLTQAALDGQLDRVVDRDQELNALIQILATRHQRSPVLLGERGVGKTAIVDLLAQRIADGEVPSSLADKRIIAYDPPLAAGRPNNAVQLLVDNGNAIVFLGELQAIWSPAPTLAGRAVADLFKTAILTGQIQCIATSTPNNYSQSTQAMPWLINCFRAVHVDPMDEAATLLVLQARKALFEQFHGISYADEALECAAQSSTRYLPELSLPAKALELLDAAGIQVALRQGAPPEEVVEIMKRMRFIKHREESAIANHEFEKARFYSDEARKEEANLDGLRKKYNLDEASSGMVTREDIEEAIARWSVYPFRSKGS